MEANQKKNIHSVGNADKNWIGKGVNDMNRDCNKCIHHTSGACSSWDCEMMTLEDYRNKVIDEFLKDLAEEHNNGWIPCSERLPESGVHVLCYGKNSLGSMKYEVSVYAEEIKYWMCSKIADVIAWQPLPAPYRKGE